MKKAICIILLVFIAIIALFPACNGCNKQIIDGIQRYDRAIIQLPNGEIVEGKVERWNDYEGDQIQVKVDGVWYLVHSSDVALIAE